ncbi:hypothetical protein [Micromonospora sp. CB01531]|uniref:hypothetical protein n=1 Tax=Micromonospora sp. CB01531 TaxID=1718947 RepID=UPI00093DB47C|nr:hypothetical protein [Micromonospora sp. CB01531]OKI63998.1 hypothetical protein A6A27_26095 [Micromonospora sp. CB01531]
MVAVFEDDRRRAFVPNGLERARFLYRRAQRATDAPTFVPRDLKSFSALHAHPIEEVELDNVGLEDV